MTVREVTEQLSIREFTQLCAVLDAHYGEKVAANPQMIRGSAGPNEDMVVGERKLTVKFLVLQVERTDASLSVIVSVAEKRQTIVLWERKDKAA